MPRVEPVPLGPAREPGERFGCSATALPWVWALVWCPRGVGAEWEASGLGGCCDFYLQVKLGGGKGRGEGGLEC